MLVAAVRKTGPAEAIQLLQQPVPSPGKGEVLVEQHASSVNPIGKCLHCSFKQRKVIEHHAAQMSR